jgi:hypothetical protein
MVWERSGVENEDKVDDVRNKKGEPAGEEKQIHNLLAKMDRARTERLLERTSQTVFFFSQRRPIQRMGGRDIKRQTDGDPSEGARWRMLLAEGEPPDKRLRALGSIVYLIRSNLVHGSKAESGDDREIIERIVPALEVLLAESLAITDSWLNQATSRFGTLTMDLWISVRGACGIRVSLGQGRAGQMERPLRIS